MAFDTEDQGGGQDTSRTGVDLTIPTIIDDPREGFVPGRTVKGFIGTLGRPYAPAGYFLSQIVSRGRPYGMALTPKTIENYQGVGLVDVNNYVVRGPYKADLDDAALEIMKIRGSGGESDASARMALFNELKRLNYAGYDKVTPAVANGSAMYGDKEIRVMSYVLDQANSMGITWQRLIAQNASMPSVNISTGPTVRVTSAEDIARQLVNEYVIRYGRMPTPAELKSGTTGIQQMERAAVGRGEQVPALSATAKLQAQKGSPAEAGGNMLGMAIDRMFEILRNG